MSNNPFVPSPLGGAAVTVNPTRPWITDPRQLPIGVILEGQLNIKTAKGVAITCSAANATTYFGAVALRGAQASVAVADTYVTCADLTGRGRLYYVIPPSYAAGAFTPTARITIDGTAYVIAPSSTIGASYRMVIGPTTPGVPAINAGAIYSTGDFVLPNSYLDTGFNSALIGGFYTAGDVGIVVPEVIEAYNMPFLQFDSSCLVEFKTSLLAAAAGDKIGGAVYRMLP